MNVCLTNLQQLCDAVLLTGSSICTGCFQHLGTSMPWRTEAGLRWGPSSSRSMVFLIKWSVIIYAQCLLLAEEEDVGEWMWADGGETEKGKMVVLRGWCCRELFWFDGIIRMDGWSMTKTCSHETCFTDRRKERDAHGEKKRQQRSELLNKNSKWRRGQEEEKGVKGNRTLKARQLKTIEMIRNIVYSDMPQSMKHIYSAVHTHADFYKVRIRRNIYYFSYFYVKCDFFCILSVYFLLVLHISESAMFYFYDRHMPLLFLFLLCTLWTRARLYFTSVK